MSIAKQVSFKKREQDLLDYIKDKDFSYYVKELIRKDMKKEKKKEKVKEETQKKKKRNIMFEM